MGRGSGRGGGRYTSMGFGFPPTFFSLIWFSWLKPAYVVPREAGGQGVPPKRCSKRTRYRAQDPFDLSTNTKEARRQRMFSPPVPGCSNLANPNEGQFIAMARALDEDDLREAMENSKNYAGGLDTNKMINEAISYLQTFDVLAEASKVVVDNTGNCLPDTIVTCQHSDINQDELKDQSRSLRIESLTKMNQASAAATRTQLNKLSHFTTESSAPGGDTRWGRFPLGKRPPP